MALDNSPGPTWYYLRQPASAVPDMYMLPWGFSSFPHSHIHFLVSGSLAGVCWQILVRYPVERGRWILLTFFCWVKYVGLVFGRLSSSFFLCSSLHLYFAPFTLPFSTFKSFYFSISSSHQKLFVRLLLKLESDEEWNKIEMEIFVYDANSRGMDEMKSVETGKIHRTLRVREKTINVRINVDDWKKKWKSWIR